MVNGVLHQNPFHFEHFNINFIALHINGRQDPIKALTATFIGDNLDYMHTYMQMYSGTGKSFKDENRCVSYTDFPRGNTVFVFNLKPDLSDGPHFDLIRHGNIRLETRFAGNLEAAVTCLVHAEYDSVIEIDKNRDVSPDYIV